MKSGEMIRHYLRERLFLHPSMMEDGENVREDGASLNKKCVPPGCLLLNCIGYEGLLVSQIMQRDKDEIFCGNKALPKES
eukprot:944691-Ditylum_brightwellii.AAC.1